MRQRATRLFSVSASRASAPYTGILDNLTVTSAGAYSTRRLTGSYTGSLLRVRRSSDNSEQDIGYTSAGALNTVALLAFVGTASGFVTTWYDQSIAANHAVQTDPTRQPRIVDAGVLDTVNGRPAPRFDGVNDTLVAGNTLLTSQYTINGAKSLFGDGGGALGRMAGFGTDVSLLTIRIRSQFFGATGLGTANASGIETRITTVTGVSAGQTDIWHNGSNAATAAVGPQVDFTGRALHIGNVPNLGRGLAGNLPEFTVFSSSLSTENRQTLERNQGAYYGITVA